MPARVKTGDLRNEKTIAHVINAMCVKPHGLSQTLADAFPFANHYGSRQAVGKRNLARDPPVLGSIDMCTQDDQIVIGLVAQRDYGKPNRGRDGRSTLTDTREDRLEWFEQALRRAVHAIECAKLPELALPMRVGCGLGGGYWHAYKRVIDAVHDDSCVDIVLVDYQPS